MEHLLQGIFGFLVIFGLIYYLVFAISLMKIAQRTKTPYAWLAFIPIANMFLIANIAKQPWWLALIAIIVSLIPFVGIVSVAIMVFFFWKICERLKKPGALSLLMILPIVQLGLLIYLAVSE